jgi:hypothetical protein
VTVAAVAGAVSSWLWAPPSDQDENENGVTPTVCGDGALTELREPMMTTRMSGASAVVLPTARRKPLGTVWNVTATVLGSSSIVSLSLSPPESVTVSVSSRCATKEARKRLADQFREQSQHDRADDESESETRTVSELPERVAENHRRERRYLLLVGRGCCLRDLLSPGEKSVGIALRQELERTPVDLGGDEDELGMQFPGLEIVHHGLDGAQS